MKKDRMSVLKVMLSLLLLFAAWSAKAQYDIDQFFFRGQRAMMDAAMDRGAMMTDSMAAGATSA